MFKKKNGRRMLSAFLALCTVFSLCVYALPVYAVDSINAEEITSEEIITENADVGEKLVLNADDVPELIDFQTAKDKGHVLRLREKEGDDHTVIFLNDDNTETMYIFAEPIKYTDSDGNVKDKKRTLTLENGKYTMAENDVQVSFPTGVNDGISVSKGDVNITMIPVADTQTNGSISATATAELVNNRVSYSNVFGTADLQYTPLYSGFKEDIILDSYTGVSEFNFIVYTNGLTPVKNENGSVSFIDPETNSAVAEMMQVVCYDAEQDFAPGDVRITTIKENGIYGFTVIADVNFLTDEDTLYPVSVDPTITLTGTTAIEDAVVYSGKPNSNYGSYHYNSVGYVDDSYKNGQLYVKFPTLANNDVFKYIAAKDNPASYITNATFSLYTSSRGTGTEVVKIYQINHTTWEESTITPNNLVVMMNPTYLSETTLPSGSLAKTDFNVTNAVKAWANGALYVTPDRGLYLCNAAPTDPDMRRSFLSTEYATANNTAVMPTLTITYPSTSSVLLQDGDSDSNNIVEVELGKTATFNAYYIYNGVQYSAGTSMSFVSLDPTVADVSSSSSTTVRGISVGSSGIQATFNGLPRAYGSIPVVVWEDEVIINSGAPTGGYEFMVDESTNCNINANAIIEGTQGDDDEGIEYSIIKRKGNLLDQVSINENTGVLNLNIQNNNTTLLAHPTGILTVKAAVSTEDYITFDVKLTCEDLEYRTIPTNLEPDVESRYIRINYPLYTGSTSIDYDTLPAANDAAFGSFLETRWGIENQSAYLINDNFEYGNSNWLEDSSARKLFQLISTSKVVIIESHGNAGSFVVNSIKNSEGERLTVTTEDILNLHQGYFSNCELIVCIFCHGADGSYNSSLENSNTNDPNNMSIIQAFADRGAKRVIGFNGTASFAEAMPFQNHLLATLCGAEYNGAYFDFDLDYDVDNSFSNACMVAVTETLEGAATGTVSSSSTAVEVSGERTISKIVFKVNGNARVVLMGSDLNGNIWDEE